MVWRYAIAFLLLAILIPCQVSGQISEVSSGATRDQKIAEYSGNMQFVWSSGGFYEGSLDDNTPLEMNLPFPKPRGVSAEDDFSFDSSYWNPIDLERSRRNLKVEISERANEFTAESTGDSSLHVSGKWSNDRREINGTWTVGDPGVSHRFHLNLRIRYRTEFASAIAPDAPQYGRRPSTAYVTYPLFDGGFDGPLPTLGLALKPSTSRTTVEFTANAETSDELMIAWASDGYLFLRDNQGFYGFGAAHGLSAIQFSHYAVENGNLKKIDISNFINTSASCNKLLVEGLTDSLSQDGVSHPEIGADYLSTELDVLKNNTKGKGDSIYLITPTGVEFAFSSDSLGEAAAHDVFVGVNKLGRCAENFPKYKRS